MANIKITGYAELAAPISTDLVEVVSDPGGTPISKKAQIRNLFKGGGQIAFPATAVPSADANTLDDYEEGDAETTITCSVSGNYILDGVKETLAYTKNGRVVTLQGTLIITSENSPNGQLKISLPFTSAVLTDYADTTVGCLILYDHGSTISGRISISLDPNTTYFRIIMIADDGSTSTISHGDVDTAFGIGLSFSYIAE